MLKDHPRQAAREAKEARRKRQAQQDLGKYVDDLAFWYWVVTISFRYATAPDRALAAAEAWLTEVENAAGGRITWALAQSRGELGGRVHLHILVADVDDLNMREWQSKAIGLFGDCQIEVFDPEKGGAYYLASNALAEHGDYRLGGQGLQHPSVADNDKEHGEIGAPRTPPGTAAENPKLPFTSNRPNRSATNDRAAKADTRKRAAAYIRISARTQSDELLLHERIQARPIQQFIAKRGWVHLPLYRDVASAKAGKRWPRLDALMAAVRRGEVDVVVVSRLDRIARNTREALTVLAEFQKLGVDFVSHGDGIDTTHRRGRAFFAALGTLNEMERRLRSERAEEGLEYAKRHGTKTGNPIGRPRAVVDKAEILHLKSKGFGVRIIGKRLGVSGSTVWRASSADRAVSKASKTVFKSDREVDQE
jgi:DNA invertase Pin-like site-specific DNA recombinase